MWDMEERERLDEKCVIIHFFEKESRDYLGTGERAFVIFLLLACCYFAFGFCRNLREN